MTNECDKFCYKTKQDAEANRQKTKVYYCSQCRAWHTSTAPKLKREPKPRKKLQIYFIPAPSNREPVVIREPKRKPNFKRELAADREYHRKKRGSKKP